MQSTHPTDIPIRVDAHAHVYDLAQFPTHHSSGFDALPNEIGTPDQFACVLDAHGFTHGLLINPLGGYGTDNRCLLAALAASKGRFKGVALLAHDTPENEALRMNEAGVVGIRFNLNFPQSPSLYGAGGERLLSMARELGWFVQVHCASDGLVEALPTLKRCGLPLVIDHCGRPDADLGIDQPGFRALLELGREAGAAVKLSGAFRFGGAFPYHGADPYVAALLDAFTLDRCLWGSDWPFLRATHRVDHATLLTALHRWLPDARDRQRVLGDNPARLFGFGRSV